MCSVFICSSFSPNGLLVAMSIRISVTATFSFQEQGAVIQFTGEQRDVLVDPAVDFRFQERFDKHGKHGHGGNSFLRVCGRANGS